MKVLHREKLTTGGGSITFVPEEAEDMWNIYNLISIGDKVRAKTTRNVQIESASRSNSKVVQHTTVTLQVAKTDYDGTSNELRVNGRNCEENEYIRIGSFHTLKIFVNDSVTLFKDEWDSLDRHQLKDAINSFDKSELAVVLIELGAAKIYLLTASLVKEAFSIQVGIPKNRNSPTGYAKAKLNFFEKVFNGMLLHINFESIKCILIGGPGFIKDEFLQYIRKTAVDRVNKSILSKKDLFLTARASSVYKQSLDEVMNDEGLRQQISSTKYVLHSNALQKFYKMMQNNGDRICYGFQHTKIAVNNLAVEILMVTNSLFRSCDIETRKAYVALVEKCKSQKSEILIFSDMHNSGEQLNCLSGIAAILRFPISFDE